MKKAMILTMIWGITLGLFAQTNKQSGWAELRASRIADSIDLSGSERDAFLEVFNAYSDSMRALWGSQNPEEMNRLYKQRNQKIEAILGQDSGQVALYYSLLKERPGRMHNYAHSKKRKNRANQAATIDERAKQRAAHMGAKLELSEDQTQALEEIYREEMEVRHAKRKEMRKAMREQRQETEQKVQEVLQTPEQKQGYKQLKKEQKKKRYERAKQGKRKGKRERKQKNAPKNHTD